MLLYIGRRAIQALTVVVGVSIAVFLLSHATGDPTNMLLPPEASAEQKAAYAAEWGLNGPLASQYWTWIVNTLHGDLGISFGSRVPVGGLIADRFGHSVLLAVSSLVFAAIIGTALGVLAAVRRGTWVDHVAQTLAVLGQALPAFWLALILQYVFAIKMPVFPVGGIGTVAELVLPTVTLGWFVSAGIMRLVRSAMISALDSDYTLLAKSKGLGGWTVVVRHALRNAVIAPITFLGVYLGILIGSAVVVEAVYFWPGIGSLAYQAVLQRDFPTIQGIILVVTIVVVLSSLLIDILYALLDPRIRG